MVAKGYRGRGKGVTSNRYGISLGPDNNVLELGDGDCSTTLWNIRKHLNCIL